MARNDPGSDERGGGDSGDAGSGEGGGGPVAAGLGALGGVLWAGYPTGLAALFRGAAPGQAPYPEGTAVYAAVLALPLALVLVGVPAVRRLPGANTAWGRRGIGLVSAGATVLALGILAVAFLSVPGRSPALLSLVAPVGLVLLQVGASALGYALRTAGDPTPAGLAPPPGGPTGGDASGGEDGSGGDRARVDRGNEEGSGDGAKRDGSDGSGSGDGPGRDGPGGDGSGDGWTAVESPAFARLHRVAAALLLVALPATLAGDLATRLLFSAVPFYAGATVPVGLGWAGACYAVLVGTYRGAGD